MSEVNNFREGSGSYLLYENFLSLRRKNVCLKEKHIVLLYEWYIWVKKILKILCLWFIYRFYTIFYRFYTIFIDFIQFLSILFNFNITILQKTLFSPKKRPLRENAHTAKYFLGRLEPSQDTGQGRQDTGQWQVEDSM